MKHVPQQLIHDSAGITEQYKTAAQLLEDLAARADTEEEKQDCLAAARSFRLAAQSTS